MATESKIESISQLWEGYAEACLPENAHIQQIVQTRRAFFAGCRAMLTTAGDISEHLSEDEAVVMLSELEAELHVFAEAVGAGLDRNAEKLTLTKVGGTDIGGKSPSH